MIFEPFLCQPAFHRETLRQVFPHRNTETERLFMVYIRNFLFASLQDVYKRQAQGYDGKRAEKRERFYEWRQHRNGRIGSSYDL